MNDSSTKTGMLYLVDLAGSEMVKKTHATGQARNLLRIVLNTIIRIVLRTVLKIVPDDFTRAEYRSIPPSPAAALVSNTVYTKALH